MRFFTVTDFEGESHLINLERIAVFRIMDKSYGADCEGRAMLCLGSTYWISLSKKSSDQLAELLRGYTVTIAE